MGLYPKKVGQRFKNPRYAGKPQLTNATGTEATFICGAVVKLSLNIEPDTKEITGGGFQTSGCGYLIAAADVLIEKTVGHKLTDLHGLDEPELLAEISRELDEFNDHRLHCAGLPVKALKGALANFREFFLEEFAGEKALICTCFNVSEERIENAVKERSLETVEEIGEFCNAGTGCGSCQPLIREIIDGCADIFN